MDSRVVIGVSAGLLALSAVGVGFVLLSGTWFSTTTPEVVTPSTPAVAAPDATGTGPSVRPTTPSVVSEPTETEASEPEVTEVGDAGEVRDEEEVEYRTDRAERAANSPVTKASKRLQPAWTMIRRQLVELGDTEGAEEATAISQDLRTLMRDPDALDAYEVADAADALLKKLMDRHTNSGDAELEKALSVATEQGAGLRE